MKNVEVRNILAICRFNLFVNRKPILGWSIAIFAFMFLYMILFPFVRDMAQVEVEMMPEELLQLFGMGNFSDMSRFLPYYGSIFGIILVAVSIFSATFSAGLLLKEEKSKSIEFLNSLAVSRTEIYLAKYCTATLAVLLVVVVAVMATLICGAINGGETFDAAKVVAASAVSGFIPLFFAVAGLAISGIHAKYGTGATASFVVLASYLLGYLGTLLGDKAEFLMYLSPFVTFGISNTVTLSGETQAALLVYVILYVLLLVLGCVAYNKRDLSI